MNTMENLTFDIKDAIEKQLPTQVGAVLKERLERLEKLEEENEHLKSENDNLFRQRDEAREKLKKHEEIDKRTRTQNKREKEISLREDEQDVFEANLKQEEAEKRADEIAGFVGMVFKSPVYRKRINGYHDNGPNGSGNLNKDITVEED